MEPTYKILSNYDHLIDKPLNVTKAVTEGGIDKDIEMIKDIIYKSHKQVKKLSEHLFDSNILQFAFNVWHFLTTNYKYKIEQGEELREPARAYADRITGIDCDCFIV